MERDALPELCNTQSILTEILLSSISGGHAESSPLLDLGTLVEHSVFIVMKGTVPLAGNGALGMVLTPELGGSLVI